MEITLSKKIVRQYLNIWGRRLPVTWFNSSPNTVNAKRKSPFIQRAVTRTPIPFPSQTLEAQIKRHQKTDREGKVILFILVLFIILLLSGFIPRV